MHASVDPLFQNSWSRSGLVFIEVITPSSLRLSICLSDPLSIHLTVSLSLSAAEFLTVASKSLALSFWAAALGGEKFL